MDRIKNKLAAFILLAAVVLMGIACGGGGSSRVAWPVIPEGELSVYIHGMSGMMETAGADIVPVSEEMDESFVELPLGDIWAHGLFFWFNCYAERGFILRVNPDDPEDEPVRISVALHPRGMNFTPATVDFINERPENAFVVMNIMEALEGDGGVGGMIGGGVLDSDIYITAGGTYRRRMKEGANEMLDDYYQRIPAFLRNPIFGITRQEFAGYLSQLLYESDYEGGERVTLTEFFSIFLAPWNWNRSDFKVTLDLTLPVSGVISDVVVDYGQGEDPSSYQVRTLDPRRYYIYQNTGYESHYLPAVFSPELFFREIIRTRVADSGVEGDDFLNFTLTRHATLYVAVDPENEALAAYLDTEGWEWKGETLTAIRRVGDVITGVKNFRLFEKEHLPGEVSLPGNGDSDTNMYFVIADSGTYNLGLDIITTAHANLMQDNPDDVAAFLPGIKKEGGIVVNDNGITEDPATGLPLVHADFVDEFDANVFVNTEGGEYGRQKGLADVQDIQFVKHVLANDGFRLIDTYNDNPPAFWGSSQVMLIERMLGFNLGERLGGPIRVELLTENLFSFANMNLLNSPNLIGVYVKSLYTDDENIVLWDEEGGLNLQDTAEYIESSALNYRYFISRGNSEVTIEELLKRVGKSNEGEITFGIEIELPEGKVLSIKGGAFNQDYFTNVYDSIVGGDGLPIDIFSGEVQK